MDKKDVGLIAGIAAIVGFYVFWIGLVVTGVFLGVRWLWLNT